MTAQLALKALSSAVARRCPTRGLIIHSDRGSQYNSPAYHDYLNRNHLPGSMSGKGNCYDNAIIERFFGICKDYLCNGEVYHSVRSSYTGILLPELKWIIITHDDRTALSIIGRRRSLNINYSNTRPQHD